jgi:3-dehydro-L-gulonate 2-dehydrogenase
MVTSEQTIRIHFDKMKSEFLRILLSIGFTEKSAEQCADIFAMNSVDGVNSHGINRFPRFVKNTLEGFVKPEAVPSLLHSFGSLEQWNGNLGPGPINATFATERALVWFRWQTLITGCVGEHMAGRLLRRDSS